MSTILDKLGELERLGPGHRVAAACPKCGKDQAWWIPGRPELLPDPGGNDSVGTMCAMITTCGFKFEYVPKPPTILCAVCGLALEQHDQGFRCAPCGREVRP